MEIWFWFDSTFTAQKMKFFIKDFFSKYDQIRSLLKKYLMENFIFCAVFMLLQLGDMNQSHGDVL